MYTMAALGAAPPLPRDAGELARWYVTPGHPTSFTSPGSVYYYYRGRIPLKTIQKALSRVDAYTLHREYKQPKAYNPFYAYVRRTRFQADLVDMSRLHKANGYFKYLLVIIDVFTRKIWVVPLKSKSAASMVAALRPWLEELEGDRSSGQKRHLYTDRGTEFVNAPVRRLLRGYDMQSDLAQRSLNKAALAERVNKTLQVRIYKYLTHTGRLRYVDRLQEIVGAYNNTRHRTLEKLTPEQADRRENEVLVREIHGRRYMALERRTRRRRERHTQLRKGQHVRIKVPGGKRVGKDSRAYTPFFQDELFVVTGVSRRMPVPMYKVHSLKTGQEARGRFYRNELTPVDKRVFKVARILRSRTDGAGNVERLVRFTEINPVFDSWIKARDIDPVGRRVAASKLHMRVTLRNLQRALSGGARQ